MPAGRPTIYSDVLAATICQRMADGESLRAICRDDAMPDMVTVYKWIGKYPEFANQYKAAQEDRVTTFAEEMVDIADNGSNDWMLKHDPENPGWLANGELVQRTRLRLDTRKWLLAKMAPKKYGDKIAIGGSEDMPPVQTRSTLDISGMTLEELEVLQKALTK